MTVKLTGCGEKEFGWVDEPREKWKAFWFEGFFRVSSTPPLIVSLGIFGFFGFFGFFFFQS